MTKWRNDTKDQKVKGCKRSYIRLHNTLWATYDRSCTALRDWSSMYQNLTLGFNASIAFICNLSHPVSFLLSNYLAHRSQSSTCPSSMGRKEKESAQRRTVCSTVICKLNKGKQTMSPRWMCFNWIFVYPSILNTQVSYLERRCIYGRCTFPQNLKLGYCKLSDQRKTRCCMNSPRWVCFTFIFVSPSISNAHISYLERRCIYSRWAFPPNVKLGYWKLTEQWTTKSCTS